MGLFIIVFYSVMCALGILLACFVLLNTTNELTFTKLYYATEDYKKYQNDDKCVDGFRDLINYLMETRG